MKYFLLEEKLNNNSAMAFAPKEFSVAHDIYYDSLEIPKLPFGLVLDTCSIKNGQWERNNSLENASTIWLDFMPNNLAWILCSNKAKELITNFIHERNYIDWIEVCVESNIEKRNYYFLRFKKYINFLDEEKTIYSELSGLIVKPVIDIQKANGFDMVYIPGDFWRIPSSVFISSNLMKSLKTNKISGITFPKFK